MHYVTCCSHRMQKHKFSITCPDALFMETAMGSSKHEKQCVDVSCPECTGMHYVTHRSQWMQKHNSSVTCPISLFLETAPVPPEHEI
jgi:hypothetical protein